MSYDGYISVQYRFNNHAESGIIVNDSAYFKANIAGANGFMPILIPVKKGFTVKYYGSKSPDYSYGLFYKNRDYTGR